MAYDIRDTEYRVNGWKNHNGKPKKVSKVKKLGYGKRKYQIEAFNALNGKRNTILEAPTGSGKSLMLVNLAAKAIKDSGFTRKQIFSVPQVHISKGFGNMAILLPDGTEFGWKIGHNFCTSDIANLVRGIIDFLIGTTKSMDGYKQNNISSGLTAVISHAALILAFNRMSPEELLQAVAENDFNIDEIHHAAGASDADERWSQNELGRVINTIRSNGGNLRVATATFYRGDGQAIFGRNELATFTRYRVRFPEHWYATGLRSFT